ncbi:hypothetical protein M378DRAFT_752850 [Amanita muscaria Koide BX008]|uniref:Uncharacterized protein n=1 Tax=Amanita muscaria (strain Koide BX008) TaxID=946122 RepID=A0A0C2WDD8_AMAMK|nr:hypothetical protein M378DRAFT_752850 [Amanita muscaria Koide BX008]
MVGMLLCSVYFPVPDFHCLFFALRCSCLDESRWQPLSLTISEIECYWLRLNTVKDVMVVIRGIMVIRFRQNDTWWNNLAKKLHTLSLGNMTWTISIGYGNTQLYYLS